LTVSAMMKSVRSTLLSVTIRRDNLKKIKKSSSGLIKSSCPSTTTPTNTTETQMLYLRTSSLSLLKSYTELPYVSAIPSFDANYARGQVLASVLGVAVQRDRL
jgi:hypothetical protein